MSRPVPSKIALRSSLVAEWGTLPMKTLVGFLENNIVIHFEIMSFMALLMERYGQTYELESSTLSLFPLYARPPSFLTACWALWS